MNWNVSYARYSKFLNRGIQHWADVEKILYDWAAEAGYSKDQVRIDGFTDEYHVFTKDSKGNWRRFVNVQLG